MSDKIKDGGSAFPQINDTPGYPAWPGVTLRDWFAGQALSCVYGRFEKGSDPAPVDLAVQAYFIADAMIAIREEDLDA